MVDQARQESFTDASTRDVESARDLGACATTWELQNWHQIQQREWEMRVSDLQRCICELLIKNQQLRELLLSATKSQSWEAAHGCDQNVTRS